MPYARVYEETRDDAKILALSDPAYRMWNQGLVYCNLKLTDGFIPEPIIHTLGVKARNLTRVAAELCREQVPGYAPLWSKVEGGYQVHDYVDWNDSAAVIRKKRDGDRNRMQRFRKRVSKQGMQRVTKRVTSAATNGVTNGVTQRVTNAPSREVPCTLGSSLRSDPPPYPPAGGASCVSATPRAEAFLDRFQALHQTWRNGAVYRGKRDTDVRVAEELCQLWTDDEHLGAMAEYFLRLDDPNDEFLTTGTRSVSKFGARASACDEAIRVQKTRGNGPLFVHLWQALPRDGRVWLEATSCTVRDNQVTIAGSLSKLSPYRDALEQAARAFNPHFAVSLLEAS